MLPLITASAVFDLGFALFHLAFWRLFGWPATLGASGTLNTAISQTLNAMLIYCLFAYSFALLWMPAGEGARILAVAGAGFWLLRAVLQPVLFPTRHRLSLTLSAVFLIGAALHVAASLSR